VPSNRSSRIAASRFATPTRRWWRRPAPTNSPDAGIKAVVEKMKGDPRKSRVTFYYLLAEATGTLGKLG